MATDIEQVQTALTEFDRVGAGLAQLAKNYSGVLYDVETPQGLAHAKAARLALRTPRYESDERNSQGAEVIARRHRHGKAWEQIGVTDEGEPMYAIGFWDKALIYGTTFLGLLLWVWVIARMVQA